MTASMSERGVAAPAEQMLASEVISNMVVAATCQCASREGARWKTQCVTYRGG